MPKPSDQDLDKMLLAAAEQADALVDGKASGPASLVYQVIGALKASFSRLPEAALRKAVEQYLSENPKLKTVEDVVSAINGRDLMPFRSMLAQVADEMSAPS
jgi:hypothetical protein